MIDLPFFSNFLSGLGCLAFGDVDGKTMPPVVRTLSSLSQVISSPASTTNERRTAERLLHRTIGKTKWIPKYPVRIKPPLRPVRVEKWGMKGMPLCAFHSGRTVPLITGTRTPARQKAKVSSSDSSFRPASLQASSGSVVHRNCPDPERRPISTLGTFD